ncbi:LysE/ArgO family amino acid transporter [Paenibacillus sp. R14(2021)]|uniref:LysE/ArgO family amino acid transporter n=1 Tax=Paenibacillus sp. R14(2021) TaxID=2859228 RepID=UPI001C612951|nr:LysE/ArgO family amino acid transporter [Paenibacillus sp. R14(2021)]
MMNVVLHGVLLGFGLIVPVGAQNMFVFNQGANQSSYAKALPVIVAASLCDTLLIGAAVTGVSLVVLTFAWLQTALYGIGFIFLAYMGRVLWRSKTAGSSSPQTYGSRKQILFALSVSLLNPHAILDTIGVIGINSLRYDGMDKWAFTLTLILVSWVWFFGVAFAGRQIGKRDPHGRFLFILNRISACIIWGLAVYMGLQFL